VLSGAGVGGGSLVYANTLLVPPDEVFTTATGLTARLEARLAPHYETARRMLGSLARPGSGRRRGAARVRPGDRREDTFHHTEVGVLFGEQPGEEIGDPYFGGDGRRAPPASTAAVHGGVPLQRQEHLDKNYLYFAEKLGSRSSRDRGDAA